MTSKPALLGPLPLVGAFVIAAAIFSIDLGGPPVWNDEAATWIYSRSFSSVFEESTFALYQLLLIAVTEVFGDSPAVLRLPSVVAAGAAVAAMVALMRRLFGPWAGLTAGSLMVVHPTVFRYAQEARPYAFQLLVATLAMWSVVWALDSHTQSVRRWVAVGLAVGAMGALHPISLGFFPGLLLPVLGARWSVTRREALRGTAIAVVTAAVVAAPQLVLLMLEDKGRLDWIPDPSAGHLARVGRGLAGLSAWPLVLSLVIAALAFVGSSVRAERAPRPIGRSEDTEPPVPESSWLDDRRRWAVGFLFAVAISGPAVALTASLVRPMVMTRFIIAALLPLLGLATVGIMTLSDRRLRISLGLATVVALAIQLPSVAGVDRPKSIEWTEPGLQMTAVMDRIAASPNPSAPILLDSERLWVWPVMYYASRAGIESWVVGAEDFDSTTETYGFWVLQTTDRATTLQPSAGAVPTTFGVVSLYFQPAT